ncbi:MAG: acyl-CoA thioesterase [Prevotellaceae bacterium]|jgi:acyl-CoA thioester hydrolase|nr:acyl-CoA thioesterase [Prevotellaceae bacterium]
MRIKKSEEVVLIDRTAIQVRFSEVDSMRIVWHGEYVRYFEDGRESFGRHFGISYMDVFNSGYTIPMVELNCQYKSPLKVDDRAIVETRFINSDAAKIIFEYSVFRESDNMLAATGRSMQVFLNKDFELELTSPDFFIEWKKQWNIIG